MRQAAVLLACATSALAYVPNPVTGGPQLHRTDFANIQFLANQNIAAGITNAAGNLWITADSNPMAAIAAAPGAWNAVGTSAVHFLPIQTTALSYNAMDGNDVIVFADDSYTESLTNGVIALTVTDSYLDGTIFDSDIFFSPSAQYSTTLSPGTFDLQSVLTHELGHAIGSNHTNILSATMFFSSTQQDTHQQTLSADDIAFASSLYPAAAGNGYGTIAGVATVAGAPLLGGVITAVDDHIGTTVGGFSSLVDGSFSFEAPPGNYYVYVEPAMNVNLYPLSTSLAGGFQSAFAGGNSQPSLIAVQAASTVTVNLNAASGTTTVNVPYGAIGIAGVTGDYFGIFTTSAFAISSGQSVDYLFSDPLSGAIAESNLQVLGAATLQPGSLRLDPTLTLGGMPVYRFTLDIPAVTTNTSATLVITSGGNILTRSGLFDLTRPQSVNAASFLGGPVAPGEILSFFSTGLGPSTAASNSGFGSNGLLPVALGGITVTFGKTPAPLFYVSGSQINLQVPYETAGQTSTLMTVQYNGSTVATTTLSVAKSAPGIFVVTNADGSVNGPSAPAAAGSTLVIYATGAGVTSGTLQTGAPAPAASTIAAAVTIGGQSVNPTYAGLTAGSVGLAQVNVVVPAGTPAGDAIPLQISMNGITSQTVNISVR